MPAYFADTYALLEHLKGHPEYVRLLSSGDYVTGLGNVTECAYKLIREGHGAVVEQAVAPMLACVSERPPAIALAAARFKRERIQAGADCSYIDAIGYASAQSLGIPFLTGDEAFRGVPGVKFVKA